MPLTVQAIALQQIAQLRLLDPSVSAEVGSPERLIIDTHSRALYDSQIDLAALQQNLNVDTKSGATLDRFLALFGFGRQLATFGEGFVTFSRLVAATVDIRVPANSMVQATLASTADSESTTVQFYTLFDGVIPIGETEVTVPIRASVAGTIGNVAAGLITEIINAPIYGVTSVTNDTPTQNGLDAESDDEYKIRFKNTLFRNLAGTTDQYTALAIATAYTSRANVIGPQSRYREYVQVPPVADNLAYDVNGDVTTESGNGNANEYTTALSTIPFAKYIYYKEFPIFVTNGSAGLDSVFYRPDVDFRFNWPDNTARNRGDAYRLALVNLDTSPTAVAAAYRPNVTFTNVYTGVDASVVAIEPSQIVLVEFAYLSEASRNDLTLGITNAVDVYIDGGNEQFASTVISRPTTATAFVDDPNSKYHYENYRRRGLPEKRPLIGNVLIPLFWEPTLNVPDQIIVGTDTYTKNTHYWGVVDRSSLAGTIRARSGIEFSTKVNGKASTDSGTDPATFTGKVITDATGDPAGGVSVAIDDYTYDQNIVDLQAAFEGSRQITTDVLAHRSRRRYFKLDITVMYAPGVSIDATNTAIHDAVDRYLNSQFYGSTVQLSDLLQVIHQVAGVDNVRWTSDTPNSPDLTRVFEVGDDGVPLLGVTADRYQPGTATRPEIQSLFITGAPTSGTWQVVWNALTTTALAYNATAATIQTALRALSGMAAVVVTEDTRSTLGVRYPIRSLKVTWPANGTQLSLVPQPINLAGGPYVIKQDFFLRDDELAQLPTSAYANPIGTADTVPGLIIRPRAQNTWTRT